MGRWYGRSTAAVIEDTGKITIQDLKTWGYLRPGYKSGTLTFSRNGQITGGLELSVNIDNEYGSYIKFDYLLNDKPGSYKHAIELVPCNYGNVRYYFKCRETGKRVTALYSVGGYYASRHYHRMTYQCSRYHRGQWYYSEKYRYLDRKSEWLKKNGHPRKANKYYWRARYYENLSWGDAAHFFGVPYQTSRFLNFYKAQGGIK